MTGVDDEEQRLRERLKAKSAQKRREQVVSPPEATTAASPSREPERTVANRERRSSSQQNRRSHSRSSSRDRRDHHRNGGNNYRKKGRRYDSHYEYRGNYYDRRGPPPGRDYYDRRGRDTRDMDYRGRDDDRYYRSTSRSSGRDRDSRQDHFGRDEGWRRRRSRSASRSRSYSSDSRSRRSSSVSSRSSVSESSVSSAESQKGKADNNDNLYTKDQRTVFVTQLVQRATERDLKKYFSKQHNIKVNDVILLRDKRTGRHKGCAYIELRKMEDISKALTLSNSAPTFQRFPILIKASEAEKNHAAALQSASKVATDATTSPAQTQTLPPLLGPNGKLLESQQVYVGSLDPSVTHEHLFCVFFHFGSLQKVSIQTDSSTGSSKGFAFLKFHDPKEANLAIQTMANQVLMGRPLKTGWATNQIPSIPGAEVVTSNEFPPDASVRTTNAYKVLGQLTLGVAISQIKQSLVASTTSTGSTAAIGEPAVVVAAAAAPAPASLAASTAGGASRVPTVAEARASLAGAVNPAQAPMQVIPLVPSPVAGAAMPATVQPAAHPAPSGGPTCHVLIHNMFDKDQETELGWEKEIKEEFEEEATKFGKIVKVTVMAHEIGGKIYCTFESVIAAQNCATALSGRWFDRRQLRTEFVQESDLPKES